MAEADENPQWFVGQADVMMTYAHNGMYSDAAELAKALDTWLGARNYRYTDGMSPAFYRARGQVDAILSRNS